MGRQTQTMQASSSSSEKIHPNHKWIRVLHALDYHRWHYVKKMIAHKKHDEERPVTGNDAKASDVEDMHGRKKSNMDSSIIEEKVKPSSPTKKGSRAARLRAMIAKEVSKKRGRHRRSATCPASTELIRNGSSQRLASDYQALPVELIIDNEISDITTSDDSINTSTGKAHEDTSSSPDKCELCRSMKIECTLGNKQFHEQVNRLVDDSHLQQENPGMLKKLRLRRSMSSADQLTRTSSFHEPKELLDALDVLSLNKQFFLRVLEDPGSSLANNFIARQRKKELTKSGSFPLNNTSGTRVLNSNFAKGKQTATAKENNSQLCSTGGSMDKCHVIPPIPPKSGQRSPTVARRFKDLRDKIKHVIRESRKDRHRITMDAVLHKVPYGHNFPEDGNGSPQVNLNVDLYPFSPCRKDKKHHQVRRTPSLDGSIDRYLHLFEASCNTESRHHSTERLKLPTDEESKEKSGRSFGRIFSSPDLGVYITRHDENSNSVFQHKALDSIREHNNQDEVDEATGNLAKEQLADAVEEESGCLDNFEDTTAICSPRDNQEFTSTEDEKKGLTDEQNIEDYEDMAQCFRLASPTVPLTEVSPPVFLTEDHNDAGEPMSIPSAIEVVESRYVAIPNTDQAESSSNQQQQILVDIPTVPLPEPDVEIKIGLAHPSDVFFQHVHVNARDEADFNYVRGILQISGYSRDQMLGTWYSPDQPLDPSLFSELESCSFVEPDCSLYEEGTHCNHLLLFDLINEELLAIYERSITYWPSPLSYCSWIHSMPKGHRVLEEVWGSISWYLESRPEFDPSMDYVTTRDLAKDDGWMNLQIDAECVGLELEELILEDLLVEIVSP